MTNLIEIYREDIVSSARALDHQLGLSTNGFYNFLGSIEKGTVTIDTVRSAFDSWFESHKEKVEADDKALFISLRKKMLSNALDFTDLVFSSYEITDELIICNGGLQDEDKSHYWFFTFPVRSFIFSYNDELYRCYDNDGNAIIECIGVGAQADKTIFRTSIRNRENDIIISLDNLKCTKLDCPHNPENGGLCNLFKISNSGCMNDNSPVKIMQIAKFVMLNFG